MNASKNGPDKSTHDRQVADDSCAEKNDNRNHGRRLQDGIVSKDPARKFNLDRRVKGSDRRVNTDPNYKGPSRRYTIDRRVNLKDRRAKD